MNNPKIKYTISKNNIFYLNFRIPLSLRIIRISLKTDSRRQAQLIISNVMPTINKIKQAGLHMDFDLAQRQINALVLILTEQISEATQHLIYPSSNQALGRKQEWDFQLDDVDTLDIIECMGGAEEDVIAIVEGMRNTELDNSLSQLDGHGNPDVTIKGILDMNDIDEQHPLRSNAERSLKYVYHLGSKIKKSLESYEYTEAEKALKILQSHSDKLSGIETEPLPTTPLLSVCINGYIEANTGNKGKKWNHKVLKQNERELSILLEAIGDIPVGDIDGHLLDNVFEDVIKGLPMANKKPYNKMNVQELVACARNNEIADFEDVVAPKTSLEYKKTIQGLFYWCRHERSLVTSPTDNMMIKLHSVAERGAFTNTETRAIYDYCIKQEEGYKKWCVPLMVYTGCRNNEIAQLTNSDVRQCLETGIWYIHINNNDGKKVKSKAGIRQVPIHSDLIAGGFLDYIKGKNNELFPKTTSKTLTRFYQVLKNNLKLPLCDESGNRLALYSTRHRFITTLINETGSMELVQAIVGHKGKKTVTAGYFKGYELKALSGAIELFKF